MQRTVVFLAIALSCFLSSARGSTSVKAMKAAEEETDTANDRKVQQVIEKYKDFLEGQDLYAYTATLPYPRGDSQAAYAIGDCNGDQVPELHLRGCSNYQIYTLREGAVVPLCNFEEWQYIVPLKNGALAGCMRSERGLKGSWDEEYFCYGRIPLKDDPYSASERTRSCLDTYFYIRLDSEGEIIDSESHSLTLEYPARDHSKEMDGNTSEETNGWVNQVETYKKLLEDESLQLPWEYVFPEEERDYLDALEKGEGPLSCDTSCEEWKVYEKILSGDFSSIEDLAHRSYIISKYESSLDEESGRSRWRYYLLDVTGDSIKDLLVRYRPEDDDYSSADFSCGSQGGIACFSYQDGRIEWWDFDVTNETYIPLRNGQMIWWESYGGLSTMILGDKRSSSKVTKEKIYARLTVSYYDSLHGQAWYEDMYGEKGSQEGVYYFDVVYDGKTFQVSRELSEEEWKEISGLLEKLLIPDREWKPASVFLPKRHQEEFFVG